MAASSTHLFKCRAKYYPYSPILVDYGTNIFKRRMYTSATCIYYYF